MIFRNSEGKIINIKKYDFVNDKAFYKKIMEEKFDKPKFKEPNYSSSIIKDFLR